MTLRPRPLKTGINFQALPSEKPGTAGSEKRVTTWTAAYPRPHTTISACLVGKTELFLSNTLCWSMLLLNVFSNGAHPGCASAGMGRQIECGNKINGGQL